MALLLEMQREGGEGGRHGLSGHQEIRNVRTQTLSVPSSVCWLITAPRKVMLRAGSGRCESYLHSINRGIYQQELGSYCPPALQQWQLSSERKSCSRATGGEASSALS